MSKKKKKELTITQKPLNEKEKIFVDEYLMNLDPKEAGLAAGYSKSMCQNKVYMWVSKSAKNPKPHVRAAIAKALEKRSKKTQIDTDWVLRRAKLINDRCIQAEPVMEKIDGKLVETGEFKFDSSGANKSLEIIGKHVDVQAFLDKKRLEHTGANGEPLELSDIERATRIDALLDAGRKRRDGHSADPG